MKEEKRPSIAILTGLAVLSGVILVVGAVMVFYCVYIGVFSSDLNMILRKGQQNLQSGYSKEIYNRMNKQNIEGYLKDSNLKYAVIKGQELTDEVLSDEENYVYTNIGNLDKEVGRKSMLEKVTSRERFSTEYTYHFHQSLLRSISDPGIVKNQYLDDEEKTYVDSIEKSLFYNRKDKILYFVGEVQMYPVKEIQVANKYAWPEKSRRRYGMSDDMINSYMLIYNIQGEGRYQMWGEPRLSLNLDNYGEWKTFVVDAGFTYNNSLGTIVSGLDAPKPIFENPLGEADGGYWIEYDMTHNYRASGLTAYYKSDVDLSVETWWVLSYVEEELDAAADDMFVSQKELITALYNWRYGILGITVSAGICFVVCFARGWKRRFMDSAQVFRQGPAQGPVKAAVPVSQVGILHRIPGLFYFGTAVLMMLAVVKAGNIGLDMFWRCGYTKYSSAYQIPGGILLVGCIALGIFVLWEVFCEVAYRAGEGSLWKNTVAYMLRGRLGGEIRRFRDIVRENLSLVTKAVLLMLEIVILEFLSVLLCYEYTKSIVESMALLFVWKLLEIFPVIGAAQQMNKLLCRAKQMAEGDLEGKLDNRKMLWGFRKHGDYLNQITDGMSIAIEERMKSEHFRTELIANVSHDVNTPLTSIINYVDLLKKEDIKEPRVQEYLEVLDRQSARLKKLVQDLMEASKAYTGNLTVIQEICDVDILLTQALGEYEEKMEAVQLKLIISKPEKEMLILADNRYLWRVFDNLMSNICKYSQPGTRVYIDLVERGGKVCITFRNISQYQLNISSEELLERFVRGDSSRNTEGSGLGLSIVQKLVELMGGKLTLSIDGDLFKVTIVFSQVEDGEENFS